MLYGIQEGDAMRIERRRDHAGGAFDSCSRSDAFSCGVNVSSIRLKPENTPPWLDELEHTISSHPRKVQ